MWSILPYPVTSHSLKTISSFSYLFVSLFVLEITHKYISVPVRTKCLKPHLLYTKLFYISFENGYLMFCFNFPYMNLKHHVLLMNSVSLLYEIYSPPSNGATAPSRSEPPHYRFFTNTLRNTTLGRTPLAEWSDFMI